MIELTNSKEFYLLMKVGIAGLLTMLVGIERESASKPAGMRTHMIIGASTCLLVSLTVPLLGFFADSFHHQFTNADPVRVLEAVVVGIGFIGAGTIIRQRETDQVKGLTTAATILYAAGIGISIAVEFYVLGILLTLLVLIINWLIKKIENRVNRNKE